MGDLVTFPGKRKGKNSESARNFIGIEAHFPPAPKLTAALVKSAKSARMSVYCMAGAAVATAVVTTAKFLQALQ